MKKFQRTLALLFCITMMFTLVPSALAEDSAATTAEETENLFADHMDISYLTHYCTGLPDTFPLKEELENKFNVSIDIPDIDLNADFAAFQLKVTANEMPDFVMMNKDIATVKDWYDQQVIRSIPIEMIREYAPNYAAVLDESPAGWKIYNPDGDETMTMAMTGYRPDQIESTFWTSYYRLDWLEKLGITPNGEVKKIDDNYDYMYYTDEPFTTEQMLEIFDKMKNEDPDGNGIDDTTGFVGYNFWGIHGWQAIAGAFGIAGDYNVEEDGKTIEYYSSNGWKNFLRFASDIYAKGYVDREWFNNDWGLLCEKYATGKYGYVATSTTYLVDDTQRATKSGKWGRAPLNMIADEPDGKILMCPPEVGPDGQQNSHLKTPSPYRYQFIFSSKCSDEKVARILSMMDYSMFSKEGFEKFFYGVEGVNYTIGEDKFGNEVFVPDSELGKQGAPGGRTIFAQNMFAPNDGRLDLNTPPVLSAVTDITSSDAWMKFTVGPTRYDLYNETNYANDLNEYGSNLNTIVNEFMANVIAGNIDVDEGWDNYLSDLDRAGYQNILEDINQAPLYTDLFPNATSVK